MPNRKFIVRAGLEKYPVIIGPVKSDFKALLKESVNVAIVSNPTVFALHGEAFIQKYLPAGVKAVPIVMGDGEKYKTQKTVNTLYDHFFDIGLSRKDMVIALGGGVVGDTAGFAAATFKRSVKLIQAPTSLLAMVDSSIGGKVGVNHSLGKNLIGTFYQPKAVVVNENWLKTLGRREIVEGLGEIVKVGFISGSDFLTKACAIDCSSKSEINGKLFKLALTAMKFKADVVARDTFDSGKRMILNFGHTFGHAIEKVEGYRRYRHGEAVLAGIAGALHLSYSCGRLTRTDFNSGMMFIDKFRTSLKPLKNKPSDYLTPMYVDKKNSNGKLVFVLLDRIGTPRIKAIDSKKKIIDAISFMIEFVNG
ncbi:MAG: 3-dehydroquinate synthase [candidate division Zixibacteria bacterium]|nr:3-dehydroquinate synthase [candidate division Zixibacteria bacterium]